jgi:hypothetical protein
VADELDLTDLSTLLARVQKTLTGKSDSYIQDAYKYASCMQKLIPEIVNLRAENARLVDQYAGLLVLHNGAERS